MSGSTGEAARAAGHRAARNTVLLFAGEVIGRLAWFAVFAGLGRAQGEAAVGVFVFAAALVQIAMLAVDLGLDRYLIRTVARDRDERHGLLSDVIALKLLLAAPVAMALVVLAQVMGYGGATEATIYALTAAFVIEGLGRTVFGVLTAHESGGPIAITAIAQRVIAAALGIAALLGGLGVVAVATCYLIGSAAGLALSIALMSRAIGPPRWAPDRRRWSRHARASLPFAAEDVFMVILFRIDAVMLAAMTTEIAVGLYGAAYRIFEATLVFPYALVRAFSAMYVYLERDSEPTIHGTFGRSIKLVLAGLLPLSVGFATLAGPLLDLTFGPEFEGAAGPLRLLAPAVAALGVVSLSIALITSRRDPRIAREPVGGPARVLRQRPRAQRDQDAAPDERLEPAHVAVEDGRALRVGEQDAEPGRLRVEDDPLEERRRGRVRALDEQRRARPQGEPAQLLLAQRAQLRDADLRARRDHHRDARGRQRVVDLAHPRRDLGGARHERAVHVRGRDDERDPILRGRPRHRDAVLDARGAVVDAREDVTVQVDHGRRKANPTAPLAAKFAASIPTMRP